MKLHWFWKESVLGASARTLNKSVPIINGEWWRGRDGIVILKGHSCNIGNAPSLVGKKLKTVICVFWMFICYGFTFTKREKVMGKLKKISKTYIRRNVWFFCPEEIFTISCKITCQRLNFIGQTLEESLQFADQSYRLEEYICFRVFQEDSSLRLEGWLKC